jgi:hypothetical protein
LSCRDGSGIETEKRKEVQFGRNPAELKVRRKGYDEGEGTHGTRTLFATLCEVKTNQNVKELHLKLTRHSEEVKVQANY